MLPFEASLPAVSGLRDWLSLIQWLCATLWSIWQLLLRLLEHQLGAHRFEPQAFASLKPRTVRTYQREVREFVQWVEKERYSLSTAEEIDDALHRYIWDGAEQSAFLGHERNISCLASSAASRG